MSVPVDGDPSSSSQGPARSRAPWFAAAGLALSMGALAPLTLNGAALPSGDVAPPGSTTPVLTASPATPSTPDSIGGAAAPAPDDDRGIDRSLNAVLDLRSEAALAGDTSGFLRTVSSRSTTDLAQQRVLASNLADLPLSRWSYALGGAPTGPPDRIARLERRVGAGAELRSVDLTYQLRSFDVRPVEAERIVAFVPEAGGWKVAAEIDTGAFLSPWDIAPLRVVRGTSTLVLSASTTFSADELARTADDAVEAVTQAWGSDWDRKVVLVVPADQKQLGRFLQRDAENYNQLAAVATSELSGDSFIGAANRVWVNPGTWGQVNRLGRSIVLRHEITHVATGAAVPGDFPIWLEEGFADYVGYTNAGVAPTVIARDLLSEVRAGRIPSALPTRADFAAGSTTLNTSYEGAWWACRYLAQTYGDDALLEVYRTALEESDQALAADTALREVVGISEAELTKRWQASLRAAV